MRLADFILSDMEAILARWEAFAATSMPAAAHMNSRALRDHAQQILEAVVADLRTAQTREAQEAKSMGRAPKNIGAPETAAQTHAFLRARSGFDIRQLAAEYRALRASVLTRWMDACQPEAPHLDDVIRFNEAIDQALAESVDFFTTQVDQARNLLLGMLGHDLRTPLQSIQMTAHYLAALNAGDNVSDAASRLIRSGARMKSLLDDLLDFNRTKLGLGINIARAEVDLEILIADQVTELRGAHPDHPVQLDVRGDCRGLWDARRVEQLLANLVTNAIKYGAPRTLVRVVVTGEETDVRVEVTNSGPAIDPAVLGRMFEPLSRGAQPASTEGSLGLGLYIAQEIAKGHGGEITARSDASETTFTARLPRFPMT
jgi:signal transduction histidine kinase